MSADHPVPRHVAAHQEIIVAAVAVADEIRVVLVEPHLAVGQQLLVPAPGALGEDALARLVLGDEFAQRVHSGVEYSGCAWSL